MSENGMLFNFFPCVYLRNLFKFSDIHRSMYAIGLVKSRLRGNFARGQLLWYFEECQKTEINFL